MRGNPMSRFQSKVTTWAAGFCLLAALCVLPALAQDQTGTSQGSTSQTVTANDQTSSTTTKKKKKSKKAKKDQSAADQTAGSADTTSTTTTTTATSKSKKGKQ